MSTTLVTCIESNYLREGLRPLSSITNYLRGEVLDPRLPAITATTWGLDDETEILRDELDADGCRHWNLSPAPSGEAADPTPEAAP